MNPSGPLPPCQLTLRLRELAAGISSLLECRKHRAAGLDAMGQGKGQVGVVLLFAAYTQIQQSRRQASSVIKAAGLTACLKPRMFCYLIHKFSDWMGYERGILVAVDVCRAGG